MESAVFSLAIPREKGVLVSSGVQAASCLSSLFMADIKKQFSLLRAMKSVLCPFHASVSLSVQVIRIHTCKKLIQLFIVLDTYSAGGSCKIEVYFF